MRKGSRAPHVKGRRDENVSSHATSLSPKYFGHLHHKELIRFAAFPGHAAHISDPLLVRGKHTCFRTGRDGFVTARCESPGGSGDHIRDSDAAIEHVGDELS